MANKKQRTLRKDAQLDSNGNIVRVKKSKTLAEKAMKYSFGRNEVNNIEQYSLDIEYKSDEAKHVTSRFDESVNNRLAKINELLLIKGKEYIRNGDKYHNFKRTAEMNRITETRALHGMNSKHIVSILDMLDDIDKGKLPEVKKVEEKIGDAIVYFVLLEALIKEKYSSPNF